MIEKSDKDLVKEFLEGSEIAFNKIVERHRSKIYWHARRMLGNHFDADEVTQQVLIVLYEKLNTFNFDSALSTWIYSITAKRSINQIRKRKIKTKLNLEDENTRQLKANSDIVKNIEDQEKLSKLRSVLDKLPVKQRQIFVLRHFDELNYEEISKITNRSVGSIKSNYFHAIKKVTEFMENE